MSSAASTIRWIALALLGVVIAAAVAFAASRLVSQRIGLASQPLNAGRELAPPTPKPPEPHHRVRSDAGTGTARTSSAPTTTPSATIPTTPTVPPPATVPQAPSGGSSGGEGGGGGDD